jgi:excinuclease ABC subunit A
MSDDILITGAREHNLKNVNVRIPRNRLTVITGLSGSGKSSLAFDTLYAEGQRRYVESLSAYARQFLDQMQKPDVDHIEGLSPAIAIEQRNAGSNPRSIVATTTEIHDYLRLLYGNIGHAHCPQCGQPVRRQSAEQIVEQLLALPAQTKAALLAPLVRGRKGKHEDVIDTIRRSGFVRARVNGVLRELDDIPALDKKKAHTIEAVVDRLVLAPAVRQRLTDSVELALKQGGGLLLALLTDPAGRETELVCSEKNACPACSISFEELKPRAFSFNSPYGACPTCAGLGAQLVFEEDLVVPDRELSLEDGAVQAWRRGGHRMILYYRHLLKAVAGAYKIDMSTPYKDLPAAFRQVLMHGTGEESITLHYWMRGAWRKYQKPFEGVLPGLQRRYTETEIEEVRERLRQYMGRQRCPACHGARLRPEARACTVGGKSIVDVMAMTVRAGHAFFRDLPLPVQEQHIAAEVLKEIRRRLQFLVDVGLDYLTLDRESATLAGGEMQRIRLATQIGSGLVGVMYVLDEPTIGLHPRDNERLIAMLRQLEQRGNTVVIVEHDEEMIRQADHLVDLGPGAGRHGGEVVYQGDFSGLMKCTRSLTAAYLSGRETIAVPVRHKVVAGGPWLQIIGATENNLHNMDVAIPVGRFVCVTGVSGSGKSTLVDEVLRKHLARKFNGAKERPGACNKILGTENFDKVIEIDQSPIGRTPRSNPVTYTGAFTPIRDLFAATPAARVRGYKPGRFSFNVKGGRCEVCQGDGLLCLEMHFLPDVYVTCEQCGGRRYNRETLEVRYGGRSIAEVLELTVDEALEVFAAVPAIASKLRTLSEVGLGYVHLGQAATTLSGGEAQRIKLAAELSKRATGRTLYLLDEPTTGLHFADVHKLLDVLLRLREAGNTVVVIEHNLDVIKCADYIIDLGPEGGDAGGNVVVAGTPEAVARCAASHTGRFLRKIL